MKAQYISLNKIISSGSSSPLLVYGVSAATNRHGGIDLARFPETGTDSWIYFSGSRGGIDSVSGSSVVFGSDVLVSGNLYIKEGTAPGTPTSGKIAIYATGSVLYAKDSSGTSYNLMASGSSITGSSSVIENSFMAAATILSCSVVYIDRTPSNLGKIKEGSAVGIVSSSIIGITKTNTTSGSYTTIYNSGIVPIRFADAPSISDNGKPVFASTSSGYVTINYEIFSSGHAIKQIGWLINADGTNFTPNVLLDFHQQIYIS